MNQDNKKKVNCFYSCMDDISRLWASVVLLEGQNKVYQAQISKLQAKLAPTQTITIQALKRAKHSHHVKP